MNSFWIDTTKEKKNYSPLSQDIHVDVSIIGGGILGISSAYELTKRGYSVAIIEKDDIAHKATGHTTAKITSQHGLFYDYLVQSYGISFAKDYLQANERAIEHIASIVQEESISCQFEWQNSYVYTTNPEEIPLLKKEISALSLLDFQAPFVTKVGLPFPIQGAVCFPHQAQFHPLQYLYALCDCITSRNGQIYTHTTATDVRQNDDGYLTQTTGGTISSSYVIVASHYPFLNVPGFYFAKMYQSTSYLLAVDPKKTLFKGMFITATNPTYSFRTTQYRGKKILLVGGGDHKTGVPTCEEDSYGALTKLVTQYYPNAEILARWNTRDCIPLDKIPYIGPYSSTLPHVYVGTGFKKWGMTSSQVACEIIVDSICGKENHLSSVFSSTRLQPIKNHTEMKNMMVQSIHSLFLDKLKRPQMQFDEIAPNSGSIIEVGGEKVGIYKDASSQVYAVKPYCTHLGCLLSWNDVDKTWDCPCHGSRFDAKGNNLYDPAFRDLTTYSID